MIASLKQDCTMNVAHPLLRVFSLILLGVAAFGLVPTAGGAPIVTPVAATAQSRYYVEGQDDRSTVHAIDGSGLTPNNPVNTRSTCGTGPSGNMWLSDGTQATWITFDLGSVQPIAGFHLWNYNEGGGYSGRGVKTAGIYRGTSLPADGTPYASAGPAWGTLVTNMTFTMAPETAGYAGEDYFFATPVTTRYLQIYVTANFGTADAYTGLSEIRFYGPAVITSFGLPGNKGVIDQAAKAIAWTMPYGTVVTNLAPTYTLSSGSGSPVSGSTRNFSSPLTYTITGSGVTNVYTVTASHLGWSYAPWTGDADSGITSAFDYRVAVNTCGDTVTVNGVAFQADATSGTNFLIEGAPYTAASGANITGNSRTLANAFIYGNLYTVTLTNLTPGATYETTFFSYGWDAAGTTRLQNFATGSDSLVVDQDLYGQGNGIRITHVFVADSTSKVFTITGVRGDNFHLSALANRKVTPATILSFGTNVVGSSAVIGKPVGGAGTIAWTVPYSANLATLAPTYIVTSGTGTPASGTLPSPNFSAGPVTYSVTGSGVTNVYTVTATKAPPSTACDITAYNPNLAGSRVTVLSTGTNSGTVVVNVPAGTTDPQLATLTPTLTLSPGATCVTPTPPLSVTSPVHYLVTAEDGVTTKDYTATVVTNAEAFSLFVVQTATNGLAASDYDYLTVVPASRHCNNGAPAVFAVASTNDFATNIYLQDYLRRYRPTGINTLNFSATISNFTSTAINATGPLEMSVYMATNFWASSSKVVLVSDAVNTTNYPNVLQASALAAALNAPMLYYNSAGAKVTLVTNAIARLGATEVVYVNAAGTKPAFATGVVTNPAGVVTYLAGKGITVDYFAVANPTDLNLVSCAKLSLTAPFVAARRTGIVVPEMSWACETNAFHYTGYPAIKAELQQIYTAIGRYPSYLALVGNAHSIPLAYRVPNEDVGLYYGSPADLDYADVDADAYVDIAIGRIMAYNIFDATLLTSRISTYEQLFDGTWEKTTVDVGGQWNSAYQNVLAANYGFSSVNLIQNLGPTQPVEAGIIAHNDHSSQHELGGAFDVWNSANVLAPAAVFSHGCAVAAIDLDVANLLIANQMFKLGAVSFAGSTRLDIGEAKGLQAALVNALFAGEPLGRCYLAAMDFATWNGPDDQRWNYIFLGDPALRINVPSAPVVAPASHTLTPESADTAILTVNVPSTLFTAEVDPTWCSHWGLTYPEYWGEKAGLYGADVDRYYLVRQTITRPVAGVEELDVWPHLNGWFGDTKLGMVGSPTLDYRLDGTTQLVWLVRANIMNWPSSQSQVPLATMTNATFRIRYSSGKAITAFNANFLGSSATIQSLSATNGTVVVYVPPGTTPAQIAALAPTYTLDTGATCNQPNTAVPTPALSLGTPVAYTVTPQDPGNLPARVYAVSVTTNTPSFRYAPWTGDADSGISSNSTYTVAVNVQGAATTVNGVAFQASALAGANFAIGGDAAVVDGGTPNLTGNSLALGADFIYGGNPRTVALLNLTPGSTYETTFFSYAWESPGIRILAFSSGTETCVLDQDAYGEGNGIRIIHTFVADSSTKVITIAPAAGFDGTLHLCALANRELVAVPEAPTGMSVVGSNAVVKLTWNASSGASSYNVKRATVSGGPYTTIQSPTTTSYSDTTVSNGTTYYYVVSAVNTNGESANSSQASATPVAPPAAPTGLSAMGSNAVVRLTWSASSGATSYNVKRATVSGGPYTTIQSPTGTSYNDTAVNNGTTYYYVVSAVNAGGESANSTQASATPVAPPAVPTGLSAAASNAIVRLTWNASNGATSYNVKRATVSGGPYTTIQSPATTNSNDTAVTNGVTYYYVVSAVNAGGESGNSTQVSATPAAPPSVPIGLNAVGTNTLVKLNWNTVSGATSYNVKRATVSGGPYTTLQSPTTTNYNDTAVTNGTTYYYVVSAVNAQGESANSAQVSATPWYVPSPWTVLSIGAVGLPGMGSETNGVWTLKGAGLGVRTTADSLFYAYQPASADCSIVAKVDSLAVATTNSMSGTMIRETVNVGSRLMAVSLTSTNKVVCAWRKTSNGSASSTQKTVTSPVWVRVTRTGSSFVGSYSTNGTSWIGMSTQSITMATSVLIGMPISSGATNSLCTATNSNVTATP